MVKSKSAKPATAKPVIKKRRGGPSSSSDTSALKKKTDAVVDDNAPVAAPEPAPAPALLAEDEEDEEVVIKIESPKRRRVEKESPVPAPAPAPSRWTWVEDYKQINSLSPKKPTPAQDSVEVFRALVTKLCRNSAMEFRQSLMTMYTKDVVTFLCQLFVAGMELAEMLNSSEFTERSGVSSSKLSLSAVKSELKMTMEGGEEVNDILEKFVGVDGVTSLATFVFSSPPEVINFLLSVCCTMMELNTRFDVAV